LSRIEKGELPASVLVVSKIAAALGRTPRELVAGTDREGYYVAQALSPEEIAKEQAETAIGIVFELLLLQAYYDRVAALFDAVYGGPYIAVNVGAEEMYIDLHARCQRIIDRSASPLPELFFPDHLDPIEDDDTLSWEWTQVELRRSVLALKRLVHELAPAPALREAFEHVLREELHVQVVDDAISEIKDLASKENRNWVGRVERAARQYGDRLPTPALPVVSSCDGSEH
jgi:hypothetical protein